MNFWTFKEDHSRGYYDPPPRKLSGDKPNNSLLDGLPYLVVQVFRLAGNVLLGVSTLLLLLFRAVLKMKLR